jgi:hypothetical protein
MGLEEGIESAIAASSTLPDFFAEDLYFLFIWLEICPLRYGNFCQKFLPNFFTIFFGFRYLSWLFLPLRW